jgi:hypothetical protein
LALIYYAALAVGLLAPRLGWLRPALAAPVYPTPDWPPAASADPLTFSPRAAVWAAAAIAPLWLGVTGCAALPDGKLHVLFVPTEAGEAALVVTPEGQRAWLWDGRGDDEALARAAAAWGRAVDLALTPAALPLTARQTLDPRQLAPGTTIHVGADVALSALDAGAWTLTYGDFRTLLPAALSPAAQAALLARGPDLRLTLLKTAGPGTGAWPDTAFVQATAAQIILWPQDTTYPPAEARLLAERGARRVPADAVVEVITDGKQVWVKTLALTP